MKRVDASFDIENESLLDIGYFLSKMFLVFVNQQGFIFILQLTFIAIMDRFFWQEIFSEEDVPTSIADQFENIWKVSMDLKHDFKQVFSEKLHCGDELILIDLVFKIETFFLSCYCLLFFIPFIKDWSIFQNRLWF